MAEKTDVEFAVAHAALKFIAHKGLTDEFYKTAAAGQLCDEKCLHREDKL